MRVGHTVKMSTNIELEFRVIVFVCTNNNHSHMICLKKKKLTDKLSSQTLVIG